MRILFIGEIVGKEGVYTVKTLLPELKKRFSPDFIVANADGTTGGWGIGKNHSIYLHKLGIDVLTSGDWIYFKKDMVPHIAKSSYLLRPANFPPAAPGRGYRTYHKGGKTLGVINLIGQSGFPRIHGSNPYTYLPSLVSRLKESTPHIIVDFHAHTTAEKYTMFFMADGMVSGVFGTNSRVQTADERILPGGTAVICDAGRTGSQMSVQGLDPQPEIQRFLTALPQKGKTSWDGLALCGVLLETDENGKAVSFERLNIPCPPPPHLQDEEEESETSPPDEAL
ncbi:TIGR00282 family metallophosphoesterase [Spirochaeta thermophila]|uniref:TIGR00282 family metallophosphoesterase n=1 Tax=Winmispira thermophila TaxID=154 RepID=UPI0005A14D3E|nr:TIGR00282 family metallophosphoesterase [Spirochaeta thermophila]